MSRHRTTAATFLVLLAAWTLAGTAGAAVPHLIFPIVGAVSYTNDFGAPRPSGGHQGNDIMAAKRSPVVAVEAGHVTKWTTSRNAGCMLYLHGRSGTTYMYIHLNNDRTLRNDNKGGCRNGIAYAPGLRSGQWVRPGELIAYVGDSGDANGIASHLHFELHPHGGRAVSPYNRLRDAYNHLYARPAEDAYATMTVRIRGTVLSTALAGDPQQLRVRVSRVRLPNGWVARPARNLTLSVVPETLFRRITAAGTFETITLEDFDAGDSVNVWTTELPENRASAWARAGRLTAQDVNLRLPN
jgi:murein DD-endopeptidase MepM/ murein hydrolase activator NlpD